MGKPCLQLPFVLFFCYKMAKPSNTFSKRVKSYSKDGKSCAKIMLQTNEKQRIKTIRCQRNLHKFQNKTLNISITNSLPPQVM